MPRKKSDRRTIQLRHPLTGRRFKVTGTAPELDRYRAYVQATRTALRIGSKKPDEVARELARLGGVRTFREAAEAYRDSRIAYQTRRRVVTSLEHAFAPLMGATLEQLDVPRISGWLAGLRADGYAPGSVATHWRLLGAIVRLANERGWVAGAPWGLWRPRLAASDALERECCRDVDELARLLDAARTLDEQQARGDLEGKIAVGALLGCRQGEIAGLRWSDLDPEAGTMRIARQWDGEALKTRASSRVLACAPGLLEILERWRARARELELYADDGPIFPHPIYSRAHHRPRHYRSTVGGCLAPVVLRRAVVLAALPRPEHWSAHSLRDTFATLEAGGGGPGGGLAHLTARMRHASLKSTLMYLRTRPRGLAPAGFDLPKRGAGAAQLLLPGATK